MYPLNAWRETDFYTEPERAALAWTEAVTCYQPQPMPQPDVSA